MISTHISRCYHRFTPRLVNVIAKRSLTLLAGERARDVVQQDARACDGDVVAATSRTNSGALSDAVAVV